MLLASAFQTSSRYTMNADISRVAVDAHNPGADKRGEKSHSLHSVDSGRPSSVLSLNESGSSVHSDCLHDGEDSDPCSSSSSSSNGSSSGSGRCPAVDGPPLATAALQARECRRVDGAALHCLCSQLEEAVARLQRLRAAGPPPAPAPAALDLDLDQHSGCEGDGDGDGSGDEGDDKEVFQDPTHTHAAVSSSNDGIQGCQIQIQKPFDPESDCEGLKANVTEQVLSQSISNCLLSISQSIENFVAKRREKSQQDSEEQLSNK